MGEHAEQGEALWYVGPGRAEIRQERVNPLAEGMVRVRASYGAISRGTEALIAAIAARWALNPALGDSLPYVTLYPAIAFLAWCCGVGPSAALGRELLDGQRRESLAARCALQ